MFSRRVTAAATLESCEATPLILSTTAVWFAATVCIASVASAVAASTRSPMMSLMCFQKASSSATAVSIVYGGETGGTVGRRYTGPEEWRHGSEFG